MRIASYVCFSDIITDWPAGLEHCTPLCPTAGLEKMIAYGTFFTLTTL